MGRYMKGPRITNPLIVFAIILEGRCLFVGDKVQNAGYLQNWGTVTIRRKILSPRIFYAFDRDEFNPPRKNQ